jgi:diguanylate cyclase (GGDEF)-like protein/PAS domain S-box-containing protein
MKRKIIISLLALFIFFAIGAAITVVYVSRTTNDLDRIIKLHQVEELRRSYINNIQSVQNNLHTINTPFEVELDTIVKNMAIMEETSHRCSSCHHPKRVSDRMIKMQSLVHDYKTKLSYFMTTRADAVRLHKMKMDTAIIGDNLLKLTEKMSHSATKSLADSTALAMAEVNQVKIILFVTLLVAFFLGILVSIKLTNSITRPVNELVKATALISSGELGSTISYHDKTEFGKLATHFNTMSVAVKDGYEKIQKEILEREIIEDALIKSENFLNMTFDSIRDPFCIFDSDFKIMKANSAYAELKQQSLDDLYGVRCYEALKGIDSKCNNCIVDATFRSTDPCAKDKLIMLEDGTDIWLDIYTYPIYDDQGKVTHVIEYIRDISERKQAEKSLRESKERYALAAQGANDGLWDWDLHSDSIYYSPRWKYILGLSNHKISGQPSEWLKRIHPDDSKAVERELQNHFNGHIDHFEAEHRILHNDGIYIWVQVRGMAVRDVSGKPYRIAGSMKDITKRKDAELKLTFDAMHDVLTGLPNRNLFMDRLQHASDRERRNRNYLFAVLFLDIDRFKVLNDSMGHAMGDEVLIEVASRLSDCLRLGDTVARFGGDEFAILLEDLTGKKEALQVADRIKEKLSLPFHLRGQEIFTSASIGIVFSMTDYDEPEHLLRNADIAMYHAKLNGSACYEVFDGEMYTDAVDRLKMETDLRLALKQEEFHLHYQPIVSVVSGKIVGLETLIRWEHPVNGTIYPDKFINIAEDTGLIVDIGEWVLREACLQLKQWHRQFPSMSDLRVSVNISIKQLLPMLVENIESILNDIKLKPQSLILEITESMVMENPELVFPILLQLKAMNVELHIDDFGTGYSSLSYLHNLPFDVLKIDRSFINRLSQKGGDMAVVKTISELARSLKMDIIAEGVENENQVRKLKALNCEYMQGYFFSKALDKEEIESVLKQGEFDIDDKLARSAVAS